ncbi:hemin uptake protein [Alcanivorax hongdengensis A-11-3]|uniref:Hemin uptake protein n=1 Tax=Alcanivorax hongdengensis A-11-3 TaxID=1177179 RepID=L0WFJ4_9GAMM|nr:hemin uptake protein HemP [Alcanivorax hongdengensis]EKF75474.1 hemin uptake protein [Alcanivorax hongdengensis A-11-3]
MTQPKKTVSDSVRRVAITPDSLVASQLLLNHQGKLWIEHAGERYLLRRTSNNRLILTK